MNIKKGMKRIALVIAIVAIVPGFVMGVEFVSDTCKTETPEYKAWLKKTEGWYQANPNWNKPDRLGLFLAAPWETASNYSPPEEWEMPRPIYKDPPIWQLALGGIVAAPLSFFIVFFGIGGTTQLVMWVVTGFRDKGEEVSTTIANSKDKLSQQISSVQQRAVTRRKTRQCIKGGKMEEVKFYRKNDVDCYAFFYFPDDKSAEAVHMVIPNIRQTGVGRSVVTLGNIKSWEEAVEKLRDAVDKL